MCQGKQYLFLLGISHNIVFCFDTDPLGLRYPERNMYEKVL